MEALAYFMIDPRYFYYVGPAILFALWAQWRVKSAFAQGSQIPARSGMSGAETAERILEVYGITNVTVEPVHSFLGDHYDSRHKVLRLSPDVYNGRSLAALGVAAHEVGHALQDKTAYGPLKLRNGLVPMASIGSNVSYFLIIGGLILSSVVRSASGGSLASLGQGLAIGGLMLFGTVVLFQLINLPVEFNASSRAKEILVQQGMITPQEAPMVGKVLSAAAMTYVAATATAILTFAYYAMLVFGGRRDSR